MAKVVQWSSGWTATNGNDLQPNQTHSYYAFWFGATDAVVISAHPVAGNPFVERFLSVENIRFESNATGRRVFFTVRNTGGVSVPGYTLAYGSITP